MKNLIPYFTLGYPDNNTLKDFLMAMPVNKINYIEFGFPSDDPRYDGPTIRITHRLEIRISMMGFINQYSSILKATVLRCIHYHIILI